jgi:GNAT superfamily N-acetyltransferase
VRASTTVYTCIRVNPPHQLSDPNHPRVRGARVRRDDVRVWAVDGGLVVLGRGVAGRWEAAIEVDQQARHQGLGRTLAIAARHLVPAGEPVWAQQAAGNARSIRAFQAAGFRPVGAEAPLLPTVVPGNLARA